MMRRQQQQQRLKEWAAKPFSVFLCALRLNFAPWREKQFSQRRKVKTEGAKHCVATRIVEIKS
jgi:hypothetical protein